MSDKRKLVLIDGNSLLYRAFFALPHFSTLDNQPTNALYGFARMMLRLIQEEKPYVLLCAFDAPVKTFRHIEFEQYKAHRKPTPDDLIAQAPLARRMAEAFNAPVLQVEGFEADDIIGTLACRGASEGYDVVIVTGDMDALQLIDGKTVRVMRTIKGVSETFLYDAENVEREFGLRPDQFPDYKALIGDTSDNIPGVPGIGPKTAVTLLQKYQTLDCLIEHAADIEPVRIREIILNNLDIARMSKRLATIVTDMDMDIELSRSAFKGPDSVKLRELFTELRFASLLKNLPREPVQTDMFSQF